MPKLVEEFTVQAPLRKVWELLSNMERFGLCVPGCKEVKKVSETEYDWVIEARILRTSRTVMARTIATEMTPPVRGAFRGEGELHERFARYKITLSGTTELQPVSDGETKLKFAGDVHASGMGGFIINKIASGQMEGLLRDFEHNIKAELEK
jgi:carbon monoxide dehydrogenase subunit G